MSKLTDEILSQLRTAPRIADDLYDYLEHVGFTRGQSKTAISRLVHRGVIRRALLRLGHGKSIYFVGHTLADPALLRRLYDGDFVGRPALSRLVRCLQSTHPIVTRFEVAKIAALEIGRPKAPNWKEAEDTLRGLAELGVIRESDVNANTTIWTVNKAFLRLAGLKSSSVTANANLFVLRERHRLKGPVTGLADWLRKNHLVAFNQVNIGTPEAPEVNYLGLPFDFLGFTYAAGIVDRRNSKPDGRAMVGDVLITECTRPYAEGFIERVRTAGKRAGQVPISFILATGFPPDTLKYLAQEGVLPWNISQLFGEKTAEAFEKSLTILENFIRQQEIDPKLFAAAIEGLENFHALFGSLKGQLFEVIIGYIFQKRGYNTRLAWNVKEDGNSFDVDVSGIKNSTAVIVECKGYGSNIVVQLEEVKRHFTMRTPVARRKLLTNEFLRFSAFESFFVTTSTFEESIHAKDGRSQDFPSREDTEFLVWDRQELIKQLRDDGHNEIVQIVEKYY